ncbi:unnamed protein product [Trichobilharzia szidati]|nr:unnamed protein product [Trichobilharzia szidati]
MSSNIGLISRQCKRTCDRYLFFDQKIAVEKLTGLVLVGETFSGSGRQSENPDEQSTSRLLTNYISSLQKFYCNICQLKMDNAMDMRDHFKSEWHIFNMNRSIRGQCPLDFELYKTVKEENRNIPEINDNSQRVTDRNRSSSSTCTESYPDKDNCDQSGSADTVTASSITASSHKHMLFFRNKNSEIIGINRCVLFTRKTMPMTMDELLACVSRVRQSRKWAVLLYSGGKFAGGIFDGTNEVVHKTLHQYTVRAKQGGGQSSYDALCSGLGMSKSAGANLRRHGEIAIRNQISDLLHNKWRHLLQACQLIFLWSPKVHRSIFFNPPVSSTNSGLLSNQNSSTTDENTPVSPSFSTPPPPPTPDPLAAQACDARLGMIADDLRIRRIPCRSKHITYTHVKELHKELSTFDVYDPDANLEFLSQSGRNQWRKLSESGDETLLETKSGRLIYGPLSLLSSSASNCKKSVLSSSSSEISDLSDCVSSNDDDDDHNDNDVEEQQDEEEDGDVKEATKLTPSENNVKRISASHKTVQNTKNMNNEKSKLPPTSNTEVKELTDNFEDLYLTHQNWHRRVRVAIASGDVVILRSLLPRSSVPSVVMNQNHDSIESESVHGASVSPTTTTTSSTTTTTPTAIATTPPPPPTTNTSTPECTSPGSTIPSPETCSKLINYPLTDGRTLLHVAVEFQSDPEVLLLLLECGCDPAVSDSDDVTPYQLAIRLHKKAMANVFRRFRFHQPDRYDYDKARIPTPLNPSKEAAKAERERERAKRQKQRQKEKRAAERALAEQREKEAAEQARFLALSDREKRALAAERRLNSARTAAGETPMVFSRCFQCACDITGKVPFTYMDYNFCTPTCLKQHRLSSSSTSTSTASTTTTTHRPNLTTAK